MDRTVLDEGDRRIYFHVTYNGKMPDKTKRFFFAELVGNRGAQSGSSPWSPSCAEGVRITITTILLQLLSLREKMG